MLRPGNTPGRRGRREWLRQTDRERERDKGRACGNVWAMDRVMEGKEEIGRRKGREGEKTKERERNGE